MFCPECGEVADENGQYCRHCGTEITATDRDESHVAEEPHKEKSPREGEGRWRPTLPILSVFASVMLIWATIANAGIFALLVLGVPAVLVIPRVRKRLVPKVKEDIDIDLSNRGPRIAIGGVYFILIGVAAMLMGASAASDPSLASRPLRWLGIWAGMIFIAFLFAVGIVTAIRINRKLRG